ncbi:EAL domain-containing protein [Caenispirillum bisanense]|uniref:Sensor protein FixL n=1 Tax=Caenispirillum bisanense TaxID=414052 RepID=A0A286GF41_9PROT|nr:EAL domain-containing protein [Caenispirillum bisanense]SOD94137.1 PAS domain S-box-containing protein/diguanylate cyclase (GGDEF) domain-containing protein [Caenispirillum bisanense]
MTTVLLVEDNQVFAQLIRGLLTCAQGLGFTVLHARTLADAHDRLAETSVDAVLLDLGLPDSGGIDTVKRMVALAPSLPVVVLTGVDGEETATQALRAGAQDYLTKNELTTDRLARSLTYAMERRARLNAARDADGGLMEGLLNSMAAVVCLLDTHRDALGTVTDFIFRLGNAACGAVLGRHARELAGRGLRECLPALVDAGVLDQLRVAEATGAAPDIEVTVTPAGGGLPLRVRFTASRIDHGVALVGQDITDVHQQTEALKSAKDRAEKADEDKSALLRALSHEVRTPLNTIRGFAEMITSEIQGPLPHPQYKGYVDHIHKAAEALVQIVDGMLDMSRLQAMGRRESGYSHLIDLAPDCIAVCCDGRIELVNPAGADMLGLADPEAAVGRMFKEFVAPHYRPIVEHGLDILVRERSRVPMKMVREDGLPVDAEVAATPFETEDGKPAVMLVARDVTERQRATRAIVQREERLRKIMETMVDALVIIDSRGIIETFNRAAERIFGYKPQEVVGRSVNMLMPAHIGAQHDGFIRSYISTGASRVVGMGRVVEGRRKDGSTFPMELALSELLLGESRLFIGVLRDITERRAQEERLRYLATRDHLTGLPNRALFQDRLEQAVAAADDEGHHVAILFIDLDHFKNINDTLGHPMGDRVLQAVGRRLEAAVRPGDTVAHLSGDEFTVILSRVGGPTEASAIADTLLDRLAEPFEIEGREIYTSGSIGIVMYPENSEDIANLLKHVDTAVNFAKKQGRNNFQFYTEKLSADMVRRLQVENGLRRALERQELEVHYQAKVSLASEEIIGCEALLRWKSADLGFVSPVEFIPVAEETGLIVPIGEWVLKQSLRQLDLWMQAGLPPIRVGVNLSARQFREPQLAAKIMLALEEAGVGAELLELELTESMLVENADEAIQALWALKGLGITLSIDDFGTGYSSLSYLKRFPIDELKIDRSFVKDIPDSADDMSITKAIISMARSLEMKLVAEGIETRDQAAFLRDNGCHTGQGYLFAKPLPPDGFLQLFTAQKQLASNDDLPLAALGE